MGLHLHSLATLVAFIPSLVTSSFVPRDVLTHDLSRRAPVLPGTWTSLGCYTDPAGGRTLASATFTDTTGMTVESCIGFCINGGFIFAGVEFAQECYCADTIGNGGAPAPATDCNMACTGNANEICGSGFRLSMYTSGASGPTTPAQVGSWTSLGCYSDSVAARTLPNAFAPAGGVSLESCTQTCQTAGFTLAGTEFADECYCGDSFENGGAPTAASDCNMACAANSAEICGGPDRLTVYNLTAVGGGTGTGGGTGGGTGTGGSNGNGVWNFVGCFSDNVAARTLTFGAAVSGPLTTELCTTACYNAGFPLSGTEFAAECYCGAALANGGAPAALGDCDMACAGNGAETCGGPDRLSLYNFTGTLPTSPPNNPPGGGNGGGNVSPVKTGLPPPWTYNGCWTDGTNGRVLGNEDDNTQLTVASCIAICSGQGFTLAGMEFADQCFCGNELVNGAVTAPDSDCNMGCAGAPTEACGGPNRISVYTSTGTVTALPVPTALTTNLPGQWQFQGCLKEPGAQRTFPYQNIYTNNNTVQACLNQCAAFGYPAGGMEFGDECWCGDLADVTNNSPGFGAPTDCNIPCSGDPVHLCGGAQRLQYYSWTSTTDPLFVWHTPANTGFYEFLIGGVVVPLVVTLGINNKIAMVEKFGTSEFANSTGAYELDLSLVDNFELAWRTMHVKSDVFCSASIVLPDKGARQLNIGGWSLDSTQGVRLYTPDGSPGVNGTNDWEENFNELHLQRQRWYPSAVLLANGSVLVVGGEVGSNGAPEPSLEILPTPAGGPTWKFLDYLNRTDPNNLYPFLMILPSGRVFIGYYNEARILDPVTLNTDVVLPNMPGSVNSFIAGRTYPMEGSAVLLPQHAPYTDPITVLICGGSNFGIALDNCVFIQPEVPNPTWTLERMPSKRVMPCIAGLPDGTFLVLNGAQAGVAGFGLGSDPNLNALLYDPTQPVGQRFSILNNTIVARMYHSEATLLYDGRVLISGSDPQTPGLPEEMRIEVYIPPYLTQGRRQPSFTITQTDWNYGGTYPIEVTLFEGTTATMRVSLIAGTSSTHGNMMGGRTLFPAFSCNGNTCSITAPPNANVSPAGWHQLFILDGPTPSFSKWVRIGGDPGRLGEWPNFPDFTLPGS